MFQTRLLHHSWWVSFIILILATSLTWPGRVWTTSNGLSKKLSGHWLAVASANNGYNSIGVNLKARQTAVSGTFISTLIELGEARYFDVGTMDLQKTDTARVYNGTWAGDRQDAGSIRLTYDAASDTIMVRAVVDESDGLYTLSAEFKLYRNQFRVMKKREQKKIQKLVKKQYAANYDFVIKTKVIGAAQGFAKVEITPRDSVTEPAYVILKKQAGQWGIILGPSLEITDEDIERLGIPEVLKY